MIEIEGGSKLYSQRKYVLFLLYKVWAIEIILKQLFTIANVLSQFSLLKLY